MTQEINHAKPKFYDQILEATNASGFSMASDMMTCSLLRTLAASKPGGKFLELGTGTGLSTSWILDGMDDGSSLISIDNDQKLLEIANRFLGSDKRLTLVSTDGGEWISNNAEQRFDYIFADTWHGKYLMLDEALSMLNKGGLYIIDDMLPQPNWPEGHHAKAINLLDCLDSRDDLILTRQVWATGIVIAVKK
ncbi:class I SAM-dependent methyltransferase [Chryseolinea sp. H1M3-3]|uniref:O-methyltransferase n=1 Tax=Chryseolinea sp. H1M3-3 TaxID=3034144 RepID=UPI0023EBB4B9|nr:class I SAM-dependent methyltransferase [Chryseolinea sp. H1M3-3]